MKIVAIGGGEIGRPGTVVETTEIDRKIIKLTGKDSPNLLFIPTASSDAAGYIQVVRQHFGVRLGCRVDELVLVNGKANPEQIKEKMEKADAVYVGGGNTQMMLEIWKKYGVDKRLKEAGERGCVLSGISAGAICWFEYGLSDSLTFSDPEAPLITIKGLGVVPCLYCPHYDKEPKRKSALKSWIKQHPGILAYGVDNCAALQINEEEITVLKAKETAGVYKIYEEEGQVLEEEMI